MTRSRYPEMRAEEGDETVGFALDDYYGSGVGIIKMFINVDKQGGAIGEAVANEGSSDGFSIASSFDWIVDKFKLMGVTFKNGLVKAREFVADKITTDELCLDDVCIDKDNLRELLDKNQIQPEISQSDPEPPLDDGNNEDVDESEDEETDEELDEPDEDVKEDVNGQVVGDEENIEDTEDGNEEETGDDEVDESINQEEEIIE